MTTPKWATAIVEAVCIDANVDPPPLKWRRSRTKHLRWSDGSPAGVAYSANVGSSGTCYKDRIVVTAGSDRTDAKLVLLHELAHWLNPGFHHSATFWDTAWRLYRQYRIPIRYAKTREGNYRKEAIKAYKRSIT